MRALGVDLGDKRIGVAISDAEGKLAAPFKTIKRSMGDIEELMKISNQEGIELIVVGLPLNMDGSLGEEGKKAQKFVSELQERAGIPVELWDERLSSFEAEQKLREAGKKGEKLKKSLDMAAAAIILQDYLDHKRQS